MKKLILAVATAASLAALSAPASAQSVGADFTVSATLSALCINVTTGTPNMNFGAYTAFGGPTTAAPTATLNFRCSKNLVITSAALDTPGGTIMGLNYTLALGAAVESDHVASGGRNHNYTVTGTMAAGQAGDTGGAAGPVTHTLTIEF